MAIRRVCIDRYNNHHITNSYRDYWSFMVNVIRQHHYSDICCSSKFWFANSFNLHNHNHIGGYNFWKRLDNDSCSNDDHSSTFHCANEITNLFDAN
jgi:hypothetical protein